MQEKTRSMELDKKKKNIEIRGAKHVEKQNRLNNEIVEQDNLMEINVRILFYFNFGNLINVI